MKALRAHRLAGPQVLALEEVAELSPGAGEVLIAVKAAGVHLADFAALAGERSPRPAVPFTPGLEVAGTVAGLGIGVKGLKRGQRVIAFVPWGGLAEQAVAPAAVCIAIPEGLGDAQGASLPFAYGGAILALREKAGLGKGETVLVLGAGGFMGLAAIETAKQLGARVIAVAGGEERVGLAREHGADHIVDAASAVLADAVRELTDGNGVDVIFDPVGGDAFEAAMGAAAIGARFVSTGFAGGRVPQVNLAALFARDMYLVAANTPLTVKSHPARARAALEDAVDWAVDGAIKPRIAAQFALTDARHAFEYVKARRGNGAVIVTV